jgi:hypothetical protein
MIVSNKTIISITESKNIDMSTFVQKAQLGEEPPELTVEVSSRYSPMHF